MTLKFWTRPKSGEFVVGVPDLEFARTTVRILMSYSWHLELHKHKDFQPMYVVEALDEDGKPTVVEEKTLEPAPPWARR